MARYWLGPWVWDNGIMPCWRMPAGATSSIDLRSVQHCAIAGGAPQGVALFTSPNAANLGSDYVNLGTDPEAVLSGARKSAIRTLLALPNALAANTLHDAIWEALTIQSDPTGDDRAPPIVPTVGRRYELWLDGQVRKSIRFRGDELEAAPVLDMLKRQYRQHRLDSIEGRTPAILYRKILGYWVRKFGLNYRAFQPADLPDESDVEPTTTITESFNTADSNTLGPDLTWTEIIGDWDIVSNEAKVGTAGTYHEARADTDLSSADQYAQAIIKNSAAGCAHGILFRKNSTTTRTYYCCETDSNTTWNTRKLVAGVQTLIGTDTMTSGTSGDVLRGQANGSTISRYKNGSLQNSVTDTAISTNLRCGIWSYYDGAGFNVRGQLDSFEAADLVLFASALELSEPPTLIERNRPYHVVSY